ncbi:hypothetical protein [Brasilonema bromeliae]|uniref:Uncharacterized protein n=1 Tax=Brasilonema bromeliae SPC951 TaxID=385972 RepID=A0ABX1PAK3_9CYAN|nr:hypothetical protein [Brasilonema bromeliae]NMG21003.1 hypothetical protein [Brasilonema bromeliae SPC951]
MGIQSQKVCKHEPGKKWEDGCCSSNPAKASTSLVPNSYEAKFATLLDWCKIIRACLDAGQVEEAKFFLEQAMVEAKTVSKEQYS